MTITQRMHPDDVRVVPEWELCDRIRRAFRMLPMDNSQIAAVLGVQPATVSTWLTGRRKPSHTALMVMADLTGVDLEWLETGTASPEAGRSMYAIRDLNPEPADMSSRRHLALVAGVNGRLTVDRIQAGEWPEDMPDGPPAPESARHLWAV